MASRDACSIRYARVGDGGEHQFEIAAGALRLPSWDAVVGKLSGGEKNRVAMCRLRLSKSDMLLPEEPINHLGAGLVDWPEQLLGRFSSTVVALTHDRWFLDRICTRIPLAEGDNH